MIRVENLKKTYKINKNEIHALRGVSFTIADGEICFVIGRSGSGKSTLLHLIGGLDKPTSGKIFFDDTEITSLKDSDLTIFRRDKIGFVFQSFNLINNLDVMENILLPFLPSGVRNEHKETAQNLLDLLQLNDRILHKPTELSGGQQQRVAIIRALIKKPLVVLADEPTGEVDTKTAEEVYKCIHLMNKNLGTTFIIATHDTKYIRKQDRVLNIDDGILTYDSLKS